ncbi:hypothetical protein SSX86_032571 [Deinandra increscens subsp. villosa]|uniref:non-specific serine/threonine protein kinase n=1 Tax=Deinandra increscens subsp. villosa TaxID=3103831 RepID=A0AAP0GHM0_9ASTR
MKALWLSYCFVLFLFLNCYSTTAQPPSSNTTVNLSTTWSNNKSLPNSFDYFGAERSMVRVILFRGSIDDPTLRFACGFYCNGNCTSFLFAVFIFKPNIGGGSFYPQVVWSANRDHLVSDALKLLLSHAMPPKIRFLSKLRTLVTFTRFQTWKVWMWRLANKHVPTIAHAKLLYLGTIIQTQVGIVFYFPRFLVYEFMCNGSLDRWIYHGDRKHVLEWKCRKKIILDVAKGLAYLHEECRQKIIHLDIKPQNILLDSDFNAKVSDFGLSKLIDRDQTHVMTTMRGTPGYMAPEWSQPEESWHLLVVLQKCWEQGMLINMVDEYSEDMQTHATEVVEMIKGASWCLQCDFTKRPSMSTMVKVLEGTTKVDSSLDYTFTNPRLQHKPVEHERDITQLMVSAISGPRIAMRVL